MATSSAETRRRGRGSAEDRANDADEPGADAADAGDDDALSPVVASPEGPAMPPRAARLTTQSARHMAPLFGHWGDGGGGASAGGDPPSGEAEGAPRASGRRGGARRR